MEYLSQLINSSNTEQKVRDACTKMKSQLVLYEQKYEDLKRGNPGSGESINMGTKLRDVSNVLSELNFKHLTDEEKMKRMIQCSEHLQVEVLEKGIKRKRDEEECQQQHQQQHQQQDQQQQQHQQQQQLQKQILDKVTVPSGKIGFVVGKQFANKNRLESTYGIRVTIPAKGEGNDILLMGPADQVAAAKFDILEALPGNRSHEVDQRLIQTRPVIIEEKVVVPEDMMGFVAGRQFANSKRIENTYDVKVIIPAKGKGNVIVLQGRDADKLSAAKTDIMESIPFTLTQPIDPKFVGLIIGYKWQGIKKLCKDHDVKSIEFDDKKTVIIKGKRDCCEAALKAINAIVDKRKDQDRAEAASRDAARFKFSWEL